jgi:hypothetical protein
MYSLHSCMYTCIYSMCGQSHRVFVFYIYYGSAQRQCLIEVSACTQREVTHQRRTSYIIMSSYHNSYYDMFATLYFCSATLYISFATLDFCCATF